jgi:hypothetical protein
MRRLPLALGVVALCCALMSVAVGCGGNQATSSGATAFAKQWVLLKGVTLPRWGATPCQVTFPVGASELRIVAEVRGNAPPHRMLPDLHCVLHKLTGSTAQPVVVPVPMEGGGHAMRGELWVFHYQTMTPLKPGIYRLSFSGRGGLALLEVAQH